MVASTDIKYFTFSNNNAPQITNTNGCLLAVLDAVLINGINVGTINSLTASDKIVTAVFSAPHNLLQYQVLKISGANQAEYNVEAKILTVPNTTSITFELVSLPTVSSATGVISASLSPMGWEKPFSSTSATGGKGAYRSKNTLLPSRPFLRVIDELDPVHLSTYSKFAKVGIVEDMTDIDIMLGVQTPYDAALSNKNWVGSNGGTAATTYNGWAKWYYARSNSGIDTTADSNAVPAGVRDWVVVGNNSWFYILPATITANQNRLCYGFGAFQSLLNVDTAATFLSATYFYNNTREHFYPGDTVAVTKGNQSSLLLQRKYDLSAAFNLALTCTFPTNSYAIINTGVTRNASSYQGAIPFAPVVMIEAGLIFRGILPNLNWLYQAKPFSDLQRFNKNSKAYLAVNVVSSTSSGQIVFDLGGL